MQKKYQYLLIVLFTSIVISNSFGQAETPLAKCKGKYFGNIIAYSVPADYNTYWNQATSENGSKWGSVEGTQGVYNFTNSDLAYNWAKSNNGLFKYHNFIWGGQTPGWVSTASTATITAAIEPYISAVAAHYNPMGGLELIDVLNEPINTPMPGNLKAALTVGYQSEAANAGDLNNQYGWAIWCFQLARKYFPNTTLLVNEYNIEMDWNNCRAAYISLVQAITAAPNLTDGKKNLIDGVGLQCHGINALTAANFQACIDQIWSQTGVNVHITEFDQQASPDEATQEAVYSSLIPVAWQHPHVAGITLWGYIQGSTWIPGNGTLGPGGTDTGILYSGSYTANPYGERPAMTWLKQYMASQANLSCCPAPAPFASCSTTTCNTSAPTVTSLVSYCLGTTATSLTATGASLKWYTVATGGTGSATAPTPSTVAAGTTSYYVSQTTNNCEGPRATIAVTVNALPVLTPYVQLNGNWLQQNTAQTCAGSTISLGPQPVTTTGWTWTGPGGYTSTVRQITLTNLTTTEGGVYTANYTDANGCKASSTVTVMVNAIPSAPTVSSPVTYCQGATATALTSTGTSSLWYTAATGGTGSVTAPMPLTTAAGTTDYYVSQTIAGCEGPRTSIAVTVNTIPSAPTVTTPVNFCENTTAGALTATGTSLLWYALPTGGTGSTMAPIPNTTTAGASGYYVSQTINNCESPRAAIVVNINATPAAPSTTPVTYCKNATATALAATAGSGGTLNWYGTNATGGAASAIAPTPTTTTTGSTTYYVSQTSAGCEGPRATETVTVNALPIATIIPATSITFCSGDSVVLNATTGTGLTYQWSADRTVINGATGSSNTAKIAGVYTVTVTNASNCSTTSSGISVTIDTPPSTSIAGSAEYITTTTATLTANTPTTGAGTWSVVSGAAAFANSASATTSISGLSKGANVLQWTISNGTCPSSSSNVTINVGTSPITQTIIGKTDVITNETGVTYSIPDSSGSTYHWTLPAGATITSANADSSSITVNVGTTGGNVSVVQTNPYGSATSTLPVLVGNVPTSQTISGLDSVTANQIGVTYSIPDSAGSTYHWTLPAGATITSANADSSSITVTFGTTGGNVSVTQTNSFGTVTSTLPVIIRSTTTAMVTRTSGDYFEVRPNPFLDYTTIIVHSATTEPITLTVINTQGVTCYSSSLYTTNREFTLGSELTVDGVYFVQLAFGSEMKIIKIIKMK